MSKECSVCNCIKDNVNSFPCKHSYCNECLCKLLIEKEFTGVKGDTISFICGICERNQSEEQGKLTLKKEELKKIFEAPSNSRPKCNKHQEELSVYCAICSKEQCNKCKEEDKVHEEAQLPYEAIFQEFSKNAKASNTLKEEEVYAQINEQKKNISDEIAKNADLVKKNLTEYIANLQGILNKIEDQKKNDKSSLESLFEVLEFTYKKYYQMLGQNSMSLNSLLDICKMKTLASLSLKDNLFNIGKMDDIKKSLEELNEGIFKKGLVNGELKFKEGLVQTGNVDTYQFNKKQFISAVEFVGENDKYLIAAGTDHVMKVYNVIKLEKLDFKEKMDILVNKSTVSCILKINDQRFATGSCDNLIKIWNTQYFEVDAMLPGHSGFINKIIKRNDETLISCSDDTTIKIWSLDGYECQNTLVGHNDKVRDILLTKLDSGGEVIISASEDKTIKFWDWDTKECIKQLTGNEFGFCSLGIIEGNTLLAGNIGGYIALYNLETFERIGKIQGHGEDISVLTNTKDNKILSGSYDSYVKFFSKDSGDCLRIFEGHKNSIIYLKELEKGILSISADRSMKIWKI